MSGEGPLRNEFANKIKIYKNIKIFRLQPNYFLSDWLKLADIHLLPQKKGFSNILFPSKTIGILASGRPVVGCAIKESQLGNILTQSGFCIEDNDYTKFIKSIEKLLGNKKLREELGKKGYLISKKIFNKEIVLKEFISQINKIIN